MEIVYISFLLFNYVSFMLSRLFNPLSVRHFWKNRIFAVKKLSQTLTSKDDYQELRGHFAKV